jgi:GNAT superfamily N-acetyltransferase
MTLVVEPVTGPALAAVIPDLARLRITVFRDFPYLYAGDEGYEASYIQSFAAAEGAVVVVARDGSDVVGAATAAPLAAQDGEWQSPLVAAGFHAEKIFYFGESVLLPAYRGRGIGHRFFDEREAQARRCNARHAAFCSVIRAPDHPRRPEGYRPLDDFWRARGYAPLDGVTAEFHWATIDSDSDVAHHLQYWMRAL